MPPISLIYLDIDDEITSAANRMRTATDMRIALVLPAGSRVATSRINFRLLAREAQTHAHDLLIVAPEAATRALAASAGLAVFASVRDLEEALEAPDGDEEAGSSTFVAGPAVPGTPSADGGLAGRSRDMARPTGEPGFGSVRGRATSGPDRTGFDDRGRSGLAGRSSAADLPVVAGARRGAAPSRGWAIVVGIVLVAFVGGFVGAQFLPAATIVVTPKVEPISMTFDVTADPAATVPDVEGGIVPATKPDIPLEATDDFPATGRDVTETKASGTVTFSSTDTGGSNSIPAGSIVATQSNRQFVTKQTVILPPATQIGIDPITIVPSTGDTPVTAVKAGTAGNVAAGAIKIVPPSENELVIRVTNKSATSGGTHTEKLIVSQGDIDKAIASLTVQIDDEFTQIMAEPSQILPDVTIFPETKSRTEPVPTLDPKTLLGDQVESFSLSMTASGTVTAVDEAAVSALATARLRTAVPAGRDLVKDSLNVTVGKGTARGADIVFPVQAAAQQVRRIVADDLREAIKGKSLSVARTTLEAYGTTTIDLWPGFVSAIPNYDFRIDLRVEGAVPVESASPGGASPRASAAPRSSGATSPRPSTNGSAKPGSSPGASTPARPSPSP